jgi:hypothetical protein
MSIKKSNIGMLLLATLFICMVLVSSASAQENSKASSKPSIVEQGLIDALNLKTDNMSTNDVIANYCKANKDKFSKPDTHVNYSKRYQLKDGSNITFTNVGFSIDTIKTEKLDTTKTQSMSDNSLVTSQSTQSTLPLKFTHSCYSISGNEIIRLTVKGYFTYNSNSVVGHRTDAFYTKYGLFNVWSVSSWTSGAHQVSGSQAEIYSHGRFTFGYWVLSNYIEVANYYMEANIECDKSGHYWGQSVG